MVLRVHKNSQAAHGAPPVGPFLRNTLEVSQDFSSHPMKSGAVVIPWYYTGYSVAVHGNVTREYVRKREKKECLSMVFSGLLRTSQHTEHCRKRGMVPENSYGKLLIYNDN